jgi:hypothetical protein
VSAASAPCWSVPIKAAVARNVGRWDGRHPSFDAGPDITIAVTNTVGFKPHLVAVSLDNKCLFRVKRAISECPTDIRFNLESRHFAITE